MNDSERGQIGGSAAEVYQELFVPALFREWAPRVLAAARVRPGQRVLDVACGTGVLARAVADEVGPAGLHSSQRRLLKRRYRSIAFSSSAWFPRAAYAAARLS